MIEALTKAFGSALLLSWPFLLTLLLTVTLRVALGATMSWSLPNDAAMGRTMRFAAAMTLLGMLAVMCAIVPGLIAFAFTYIATQAQPSESLVMELHFAGGTRRVGVLVVVTGLVLSMLSAGAGAILWLLLGSRMRYVPLRQWVLRNAALWTLGFVGSLIAALATAVLIPGISGGLILGIGGLATGLAAEKWIRDVAEYVEPAPELDEDVEPVDFRAPEAVSNPGEWQRQTRTGA